MELRGAQRRRSLARARDRRAAGQGHRQGAHRVATPPWPQARWSSGTGNCDNSSVGAIIPAERPPTSSASSSHRLGDDAAAQAAHGGRPRGREAGLQGDSRRDVQHADDRWQSAAQCHADRLSRQGMGQFGRRRLDELAEQCRRTDQPWRSCAKRCGTYVEFSSIARIRCNGMPAAATCGVCRISSARCRVVSIVATRGPTFCAAIRRSRNGVGAGSRSLPNPQLRGRPDAAYRRKRPANVWISGDERCASSSWNSGALKAGAERPLSTQSRH